MIIHKTYKDLTPEQRRAGARVARQNLQPLLSSPVLTQEQRNALQAKLRQIAFWEAGRLPE